VISKKYSKKNDASLRLKIYLVAHYIWQSSCDKVSCPNFTTQSKQARTSNGIPIFQTIKGNGNWLTRLRGLQNQVQIFTNF